MKISSYDPITGNLITSDISKISFGDVIQGQHNTHPIVLRVIATSEATISNLKIFLEKGFNNSNFGYYINSDFVKNVKSGSDLMSNHFTEVSDAASSDPGGISIPMSNETKSNYIWIDIDATEDQTGVSSSINFRFTCNYT